MIVSSKVSVPFLDSLISGESNPEMHLAADKSSIGQQALNILLAEFDMTAGFEKTRPQRHTNP